MLEFGWESDSALPMAVDPGYCGCDEGRVDGGLVGPRDTYGEGYSVAAVGVVAGVAPVGVGGIAPGADHAALVWGPQVGCDEMVVEGWLLVSELVEEPFELLVGVVVVGGAHQR